MLHTVVDRNAEAFHGGYVSQGGLISEEARGLGLCKDFGNFYVPVRRGRCIGQAFWTLTLRNFKGWVSRPKIHFLWAG
jgi:hypothetical protein